MKLQRALMPRTLEENDHVSQTDNRPCCDPCSRRRRAHAQRRVRQTLGGFGGFHHFHHFGGIGFGVGYVDDGCLVTQRVLTPYGYRLRTVNVCEY